MGITANLELNRINTPELDCTVKLHFKSSSDPYR